MENKKTKYALISVYDKTAVLEFARVLQKLGYRIISTGGTAKTLTSNKIQVIPIQEITKNPESFDGRMKTISFQVESGILFDRKNPKHVKEARQLDIKPIDIVVCNLYPFEAIVSNSKSTKKEIIENIDVGGPTMIRAAAKNFENLLVVIDPGDYAKVTRALINKKITDNLRRNLAAKAFAHLSLYDSLVAKYLRKSFFSQEITIPGRKVKTLRYGENPHQKAALYFEPNTTSPLKNLKKFSGRDLSLINVTDINAGVESVRLFKESCAVVIKHNTPCGIAQGENIGQALERAIEADPESAFGGVIVLNQPLDINCAKIIAFFKGEKKGNIDIVATPKINKNSLAFLKKIRKSMGIYTFGKIKKIRRDEKNIKWINGGFVLQTVDNVEDSLKGWGVVTKKQPTKKELAQMIIAWKFLSRIKSNSIVVIDKKLPLTRGIGSGQTSRIKSTKIALEQAGKFAKGAILASDSFFPFDDCVKMAGKSGISAIVQQGGSVNDNPSIKACNKVKMAMVFTHKRAFWH